MIRQGNSSQCASFSCAEKPFYCLEWWGLNQHGENPLVVFERYSCAMHLLNSAIHECYGGYPDEIQDAVTLTPKPRLLAVIKKAFDEEWESERLEGMLHIVDPPKEQLSLFPDDVPTNCYRNV